MVSRRTGIPETRETPCIQPFGTLERKRGWERNGARARRGGKSFAVQAFAPQGMASGVSLKMSMAPGQ